MPSDSMLSRLFERRRFRRDLLDLMEDERFQRFFRTFLRHSGVTRSRFSNDPYEITASEATRRLAMSYLHLMGKDDPQDLIKLIEEQEHQNKENQNV